MTFLLIFLSVLGVIVYILIILRFLFSGIRGGVIAAILLFALGITFEIYALSRWWLG